jgi:hypothetical protein
LFAPPSDDAFAVPYVVILRAIFHLATAHIGVPTGATGIAQQHENLLNIMLWIELSPEKYFEPRSNAVNIVSNNQPERRRSLNELPTAVAKNYNFSFVNTPGIAGKEVFKYVEHLL